MKENTAFCEAEIYTVSKWLQGSLTGTRGVVFTQQEGRLLVNWNVLLVLSREVMQTSHIDSIIQGHSSWELWG